MNNGAQGQPPAPGQPRPMQLFRPEQMRKLPDNFSAAEKVKWEQGLSALWAQVEKNPEDSTQHTDAKRKLFEFSRTLHMKLQNYRQQQAAAAAGGRPASQGQAPGSGGINGQNPNAARNQIPQKILDHVNNFPFTLPPHITSGTPEATKWIQDAKSKYVKGLMAMDTATGQLTSLDSMAKKRNDEGNPFNAQEQKEFDDKKSATIKRHSDAKNYVDTFRQGQNAHRAAAAAVAGAGQPANVAQTGNEHSQTAARPQMNLGGHPSNPALQSTQAVNAAIEAARNQQMGGGRPMTQNGPPMPNQNAPSNPNIPQHQGGPVQNIKQEAGVGVPHINTQMQMQGRPMPNNNSPQSAIPQSAQSLGPQSATSTQPRALTHPQALQQASRTYSSGQTSGTPNVMGHSHSHPSAPRETQNVMTQKMPIPKNLPDRANAPPQAVAMANSRPTYSGGPNGAGHGVMSQPVLQKPPGYNLEGDGDRILNKKKLDELVRQVTGGGDGLGGGEVLSADVEESILTVADTFVDQVLQAACKNAKERGSSMLEIRDIQLTLERGYNIRIPGYASDEIRTVRKIQPAPAWISKMSAVQASKVTGGKNLD